MKHPLYKLWLSHFTELSLEKSSSSYNPYLEVRLVQGRHQLLTKDAVYSFDDKYLNFLNVFKRFKWEALQIENVLVLGLGLGSVIYMLEKIFEQDFIYTAVEIDPEICRLAHKYTLSDLNSFTELYTMDGLDYLQGTNSKFDLIIMDIFQSALIPEIFQTRDYLHLLADTLAENGCILYNRMELTQEDRFANEKFKNIFAKVFPASMTLPVRDNLMFISDRNFVR